MRLLDAIKSSSDYLEKSGVEDSLVDAELLALHAAGIDRLRAYMDNPEIDRRLSSKINRLMKRRAGGEPLQYIIGQVDFLGLRIRVGKGVLIPRPETELLVQEAIKTVKRNELWVMGKEKNSSRITHYASRSFLDLCTGSGCIALALAKEFPGARIYGTDVSARAIKYAKGNADYNGIKNVMFLKGSLFGPAKEHIAFDLITANPPYIPTPDIAGLQREIKDWEPVEALNGGKDGLDFYRKILSKGRGYLKEHGCILLELGFGQSEDVREIARGSGFKNISVKKDFAGIDRILEAEG
ncbi:MAG: peptide chain release factor N(5)-glutamine methyltransferase [Nitrospira bacterium HGW-Nitrospira-1]|nr:MAG: peptide chain release factor N(5)-glutamine methyltransferase [Nitrospira bacterium HGW-Nitrospira-1]